MTLRIFRRAAVRHGAALVLVGCAVAGAAIAVRSARVSASGGESVPVKLTTLLSTPAQDAAPLDTPRPPQQAFADVLFPGPVPNKPGTPPDNYVPPALHDTRQDARQDNPKPDSTKEVRLASAAPDQVVPQETIRQIAAPKLDVVPPATDTKGETPKDATDETTDDAKDDASEQARQEEAKVIVTDTSFIDLPDNCSTDPACIDRYLFTLYERAPKLDAQRVKEKRKVKVRNKKGKLVTRTRTFTRVVHEDFTWKDPKAAEKAGMSMQDYVIGGMDKKFKLKIFQLLREAEIAGLTPGITSAFRDDYRQSIATGTRAASNRSFHGGSLRGGYGYGLAIDVVSLEGETRGARWLSTMRLWKWIDENGRDFGLGRPYRDFDPPHVTPIDGREYEMTAHRRPAVKQAKLLAKGNKLPVRLASASPVDAGPQAVTEQPAAAAQAEPSAPVQLASVPKPRPKPAELIEAQQKNAKPAGAKPRAQAKPSQTKQASAKQGVTAPKPAASAQPAPAKRTAEARQAPRAKQAAAN